MSTGCQGPFCHGTGGWCGCDCNCCPPPCCSTALVFFAPQGVSAASVPGVNLPTSINLVVSGTGTDCDRMYPMEWNSSRGQYETKGPIGTCPTGDDPAITLACGLDGSNPWDVRIDGILIAGHPTGDHAPCLMLSVAAPELASCCGSGGVLTFQCIGAEFTSLWANLSIPNRPQTMPAFDYRPITSPKGDFMFSMFGADGAGCSVPCTALSVPISPGGPTPACCIEVLGGVLYVVGNGFVTAPATVDGGACGILNVKINGQTPPVFLNDCSVITVTLEDPDGCCNCEQTSASCTPSMAMSMWRFKTRMGKQIVNPKTGRPKILLNRNELIRRLAARQQKLRRNNP